MTVSYQAERQVAEYLAREAGALLLRYRAAGFDVDYKTSPDDPVTVADREASELIVAGLRAHFPADGLLSEELSESPSDVVQRLARARVWSVDPIDGTKEFVAGRSDYAVSIGLSVGGEAVMGVVYAPSTGALYSGAVGEGVWQNSQPSGFSKRPLAEALVAVSGSEYRRDLSALPWPGLRPSGSIALKLAHVATGAAEATFTISPRSEWDIAAGLALIAAAGGVGRKRGGARLRLNAVSPHLRQGLVAGRTDVVTWLEAELWRLHVPLHQLAVQDTDTAWSLLSAAEQAAVKAGEHLHLRHAAGQVRASLALDVSGAAPRVRRVTGDAAELLTLTRDVQRAYGALTGN